MQSFLLQRRNKFIIGGVLIAVLALMLVALQQQFNEGDYRRALELIAARHPAEKWSIGQELMERAKNAAPDCRPKLISAFRGTVEIICSTGERAPYRFEVDLVRRSVRPLDAAARSLVETVAKKNQG